MVTILPDVCFELIYRDEVEEYVYCEYSVVLWVNSPLLSCTQCTQDPLTHVSKSQVEITFPVVSKTYREDNCYKFIPC